MRFKDPFSCHCDACGKESALRVKHLLALTAVCPHCGTSQRAAGERMRAQIDDWASFYDLVTIVMDLEERLQLTIPDESLGETDRWSTMTLHDLATRVANLTPNHSPENIAHAIRAAVSKKIPTAPVPLNFSLPLLDALNRPGKYGGYD